MTLIAPVVVFVLFLILGLSILRRRWGIGTQMALMFAVAYISVFGQSYFFEHQYLEQLNAYDIDGSGSFDQSEQVEGFEEAMERVTHDTGRTFAPILGFIISAIFSCLLGVILKLFSIFRAKLERRSENT